MTDPVNNSDTWWINQLFAMIFGTVIGVAGLVVAFRGGVLALAGMFAVVCAVVAWLIALRPPGSMRWTRKPTYANNLILAGYFAVVAVGWAVFGRWPLVLVFAVGSVVMVGTYVFRPKEIPSS